MKAGTKLSLSCVFAMGATAAAVYFYLTVWGMSIGFSVAVGCLRGGSAWYVVQKQGLREGERCGWINTIDTKGLGSRDLLFSSTLPSISLNPRPSPPHFPPPSIPGCLALCGGKKVCWSKRSEASKSVFTNNVVVTFEGETGIMGLLNIKQGEGEPKRATTHWRVQES